MFNVATDRYLDHVDISMPSDVEMIVRADREGYAKVKIFHVGDEYPFALTSHPPDVRSLGVLIHTCEDIVASNGSQSAKLFAAGEMVAEGTLKRMINSNRRKCFECRVADEALFMKFMDIVANAL